MSMQSDAGSRREYHLRISRNTVEKLGVKLYDRASAVIAELVSNAYDADARKVTVKAPMGVYLAKRTDGAVSDIGTTIEVQDDGIGMTPGEMQDFFLWVGKDRRLDNARGAVSKVFKRPVTGRKGVGKLAPFGICRKMEIISSGGETVTSGAISGYVTSHVILNYDDIVEDTDYDYRPITGSRDGELAPVSGTLVRLSSFEYKMVPGVADLARQLAQRFGLASAQANWTVELIDESSGSSVPVTPLDIPLTDKTRLAFEGPAGPTTSMPTDHGWVVRQADNTVLSDLKAGFGFEGRFYPVRGWIGLSRNPFKDDIASGIRIYCRKKFAAQTATFNRRAGLTNEILVRAYLVGEIECDWLDEDEDLISTDRKDVLWSADVCGTFQDWGQAIVDRVARIGREPIKERLRKLFAERSDLREKVRKAFPSDPELQRNAVKIGEILGSRMSEEELNDPDAIESVLDMMFLLAPLRTLEDQLERAASDESNSFQVIGSLLRTARIAEVYSLGRLVEDRIAVIEKLRRLREKDDTDEASLQRLIAQAPWLIDAKWVLITENRSLKIVREELTKHLTKRLGFDVNLGDFTFGKKRPDFVLVDIAGVLHFIEIKRPNHKFDDTEMARVQNYIDALDEFVNQPGNTLWRDNFQSWKITLVTDGIELKGMARGAFQQAVDKRQLEHIDWASFLGRTEEMHRQFLEEAELQKTISTAVKP